MAQHAGPRCWLSNKHQGTEETKSQREKDKEAEFRVIHTNNCGVFMIKKDNKDSHSEAGTNHGGHGQGYTQGIIGQELHFLRDASCSVLVRPEVIRAECALY